MFYESNNMANFSFVSMIIIFVIIIIVGVIVVNIVKGVGKWSYNNSQQVLSVPARVISKRTKVSSRVSNDINVINDINDMNHTGVHHHTYTYTSYFIAFEVESGSRMEFKVKDNEFGVIAENDTGNLTFQGGRYMGFVRNQ